MKARKFICCILIPIALLLGVLSMPSSSNVNYLPALDFNSPYTLNDSAEDLLFGRINEIRSKNGLSHLKRSEILNKTANYKSLYISQYRDSLNSDLFVSGPLNGKRNSEVYPYVKKEEVICMNNNGYIPDDIIASYFAKTLQNGYTQGRILLDSNTKTVGISIIYFDSYILCVIHSSDAQELSSDVNVIPDEIVKKDTNPPVVTVDDVYIAKDYKPEKNKIDGAVKYSDNSGTECTLSYDLKQIDTSKTGVYSLNISVTDNAGNRTEAVMKVSVVPHVSPVISNEVLVLPDVPFDDIYDLSKYIDVNDNYGIEYINTKPAYALKSDEGKSVRVTVMNKAGLVTEKTLTLTFGSIEHYDSPAVRVNPIYPADNEPLTVEMIKSAVICRDENVITEVDNESFNSINREVTGVYFCFVNVKVFKDDAYIQTPVAVPVHISSGTVSRQNASLNTSSDVDLAYSKLNRDGYIEENAHIVLSAVTSRQDVMYAFTVRKYGEKGYTVNRSTGSLIWYPETEGLYEINVSVKDGTDAVVGTSTINLFVSDKTTAAVRKPYIELKPESEYILDSINLQISNIVPKLKASDFLSNFAINDGGVAGVSLRVTNSQGTQISGDSFVGTGSVIELYKEDTVYEKYEILLYGDINGDGTIDVSDYAYIRQNILGNVQISGIKFIAANIAERDIKVINISDYAMLRQHLLGNYEIKQK